MKTVSAQELREIAVKVLITIGLLEEDAGLVANHLVEANLRGRDSHGVLRLPHIVKGIKKKAISTQAQVETVRETAATALLDAKQGIGQVVALKAMHLAIKKAGDIGIGIVSMRNASHIGFIGYYTEYAAKQGMIGVAFCNTESAMAPFGGAEPILGTNPISITFPTREEPIVVDMATSLVARGKIIDLSRKGQRIPKGWAVDSEGRDTEDPVAALAGALLPVGGPKGYCLAFGFDVLAGALAGACVGTDVRGTVHTEEVCTKGDLFIAIDPQKFCGLESFLDRVERLKEQIKACKKAPGVTQIYLPGDPEWITRQKRQQEGIPVDEKLWSEVTELAKP